MRRAFLTVRILPLLLLAALAAAAQDATQPDVVTEQLRGVVVSSVDGQPVSRVLVTSPDRRMATMTDFAGRFSFQFRHNAAPQAPPNPFFTNTVSTIVVELQLRKPGYVASTIIYNLPLTVLNGERPAMQLTIHPAGIIAGEIDLPNGATAQNLRVQLYRRSVADASTAWNIATSTAVTDAGGNFRFPGLAAGEYKVSLPALLPPGGPNDLQAHSMEGLAPAFYQDAPDLDDSQPIELASGASVVADLAPHRATFYRVTIPVTGGEFPALRVSILPQDNGFSLRFDPKTRLIQGYLPSGNYTLSLLSNGPAPRCATMELQVSDAPVTATPVALHPLAEIPIQVQRDLVHPQDSATQHGPGDVFNAIALQPGNFAVNRGAKDAGEPVLLAEDGLYHFVFLPQNSYVASIVSGSTDLLREPLLVPAGGNPPPIQVVLRDDAAVLSILVDQPIPSDPAAETGFVGSPILRAYCISLDQPERMPMSGESASQQPIAIQNLAPGRYLVLAMRQNTQLPAYRDPGVLQKLMSQGTVVSLSANEDTVVHVPLMPEDDR